MSIFDDDPFENILKDFFGRSPARERRKEAIISGEEEDRVIDFVEDNGEVYLVFEFPGYNEKDVLVVVKGRELEIRVRNISDEGMQDYLSEKLSSGVFFKKTLPDFINPKKFSHTVRNGILEVVFEKK